MNEEYERICKISKIRSLLEIRISRKGKLFKFETKVKNLSKHANSPKNIY
jgi:hypothetical protein